MTPDSAKAMYRRQLAAGEDIILRRVNVSPTPNTDIPVRARVIGYRPEEMVGGIQAGDRKIIVLADDVTFDPPLKKGDKAVVRGRVLNLEVVDDNTRRVGGVLIAYELVARG